MFRFFLILSLLALADAASAQEGQTWIAGYGMGAAFGVNEAVTKPLVLSGRAEAVAFNSIVPGVSPEFGISIFTIEGDPMGTPTHYRTQIIAPDLRFRFSPLTTITWFPYVYAGAGMAIYKVLEVPSAANPLADLSDGAPFFTLGIGVSHQIIEQIGLDLNIGAAEALSDDINPVHDSKNDGWWNSVLSVYWIF
ncbi:MAG TPA: hypothetical protein VGM92_10845 [Candidatus Kapabacteria bacterium]|jgi:hypothetical protein